MAKFNVENAAWDGFVGGTWQEEIDVRDFIRKTMPNIQGRFLLADQRSNHKTVGSSHGIK